MTKEVENRKRPIYKIGVASGILAVLSCITSLALSVVDHDVSVYMLAAALFLLGFNQVALHLSNFRENILENILITGFIFILAVLVSLSELGIYFLITSFFLYCVTIIISRLFKLKKDHSTQSIIFNCLYIAFLFLISFVFFFPQIYAKGGTTVKNTNFITMCFAVTVLFSSGKNLLFPYHKELKINVIADIIKKSLVYEILLGLAILVVLCSIYFTLVEVKMTTYVDSLWYSFSLITTIGLGDFSVGTTLGRILSVLLGISGIIVVALFTSVIVNFYNVANKKREEKEMKKIMEKVEEIEEIEENIEENEKN